MNEKIFECVYSRADYDDRQKSIFTKDILGSSSWKGEEKIVLFNDRIETYLDSNLIEKHFFTEFESFYIGEWSDTNCQILLIKKPEYLTSYQKNIAPIFSGKTQVVDSMANFHLLLDQSFVLNFKKEDCRQNFSQYLERYISKTTDLHTQSYTSSNTSSRFSYLVMLFIVVLIVILLLVL